MHYGTPGHDYDKEMSDLLVFLLEALIATLLFLVFLAPLILV